MTVRKSLRLSALFLALAFSFAAGSSLREVHVETIKREIVIEPRPYPVAPSCPETGNYEPWRAYDVLPPRTFKEPRNSGRR